MNAARLRSAFPVLKRAAYLNAGTCGPVAAATQRAAVEAWRSGTRDGCGRVIAGLELGPGDEILTADDEHPGLQGPLVAAREQRGVTIRAVPPAELPGEVGTATKLVACSHVSWHSGALAPVEELAAVARDGVPVLLDGAQSAGA